MMTKLADPRNDIAFKKIFSEDNIEGIKDFAESIIIDFNSSGLLNLFLLENDSNIEYIKLLSSVLY